MIVITDEQIKAMAEAIQPEIVNDELAEVYPLEQLTEMVENWLMRLVHRLNESPAWYATCSGQIGIAKLPAFTTHLQCINFNLTPCYNEPLPGNVYCEECLTRMVEDCEMCDQVADV